jgi:hypothetical protein
LSSLRHADHKGRPSKSRMTIRDAGASEPGQFGAGGTAAAALELALGSAAMAAAGFALGALGRRAVAKFSLRGASI